MTSSTPWVPMDKIVLMGDSITEQMSVQDGGFVLQAQLEWDYVHKLDVVNRGFSGYTTDLAVTMLRRQITPPNFGRIRIFTICYGANDACLSGQPQHVPLDRYRANLLTLATHPAIRAHGAHIVLITPPPIDDRKCTVRFGPATRSAVNTARYARVARAVAREAGAGVLLVDFWAVVMRDCGWMESVDGPLGTGQDADADADAELATRLPGSAYSPVNARLQEILRDGCHLSSVGYRLLYDELKRVIASQASDVDPGTMSPSEPLWRAALEDLKGHTGK